MERQLGRTTFDKGSICSPESGVIHKDFQTLTNRSEMYHTRRGTRQDLCYVTGVDRRYCYMTRHKFRRVHLRSTRLPHWSLKLTRRASSAASSQRARHRCETPIYRNMKRSGMKPSDDTFANGKRSISKIPCPVIVDLITAKRHTRRPLPPSSSSS